MTIGPREQHLLDQFLAWNLDVQARLKRFQDDLVEMGHSEAEAWALARDLEQRILGPVMQYVDGALPVEREVDELIRQRMEELGDGGDEGE